jgi:hypothetical protein
LMLEELEAEALGLESDERQLLEGELGLTPAEASAAMVGPLYKSPPEDAAGVMPAVAPAPAATQVINCD